jgi:ectoine hydroxylase
VTPTQHYKDSLRRQEYGVPSPEVITRLVAQGGMTGVYGPPGTLVIHECNMLHGSPDNISPHARSNLFFVYNSVLNTPAPRPYAATAFRPEFLGRRNFQPLQPMENLFS